MLPAHPRQRRRHRFPHARALRHTRRQPLRERPRGKFSSGGLTEPDGPTLPRLSVADCLHYTLTMDPDVALLGLSYPNEQDAAFRAALEFSALTGARLEQLRGTALEALQEKGPCWWNPNPLGHVQLA